MVWKDPVSGKTILVEEFYKSPGTVEIKKDGYLCRQMGIE